MSIWGTIIGGAAGFALGGPLGALIGLAAGRGVDELRRYAAAQGGADDPARSVAFTIAVIALGAKMAKADGRVTRSEVNAFRAVFHVPEEELANVARVFDLAKRDVAGYDAYARQLAEMFAGDRTVLEEVIDALFHVAKADGVVDDQEIGFLKDVARLFGLSDADFARIRESQLGPDAADPYTVLGVARDADDETVRAAWLRLVREHHPDRLVAHGMPAEFAGLANEQMAVINAAYDHIRAERSRADAAR